MPRSRDILQRFRLAGTPGAASAAGVPADRVAEIAAELAPVIARVADAQTEADRIRAEAAHDAERRRAEALRRAGDLVASAHREAAAERADAALRVRRQVEAEGARTQAAGADDAAAVRRRATERLPGYVDRVTREIRASLQEPGP